MPKIRINFRGFLTNVDSSILQLKLKYGFKIKALSENEAFNFMVHVAGVSHMEAGKTLFMRYPCLDSQEKQVYVVYNSIDVDTDSIENIIFDSIARFSNKHIHNYLIPTFRVMRLFKAGDLRMPLHYYYIIKNEKPSSFMSGSSSKSVSHELFHLESSELGYFNNFLQETTLPFKKGFLQLAFGNFELSYEISNVASSFLTLMISMETLLNPGEHELRYRISRNTAVLLGTNEKESKAIFSEMKEL